MVFYFDLLVKCNFPWLRLEFCWFVLGELRQCPLLIPRNWCVSGLACSQGDGLVILQVVAGCFFAIESGTHQGLVCAELCV